MTHYTENGDWRVEGDDDLSVEEQDRLEAMGTPVTQTETPSPMRQTWSTVAAMERSHRWRVYRSIPSNKSCQVCGDTLDSGMRYCPGRTIEQPSTGVRPFERHIDVPPLERTDGMP